MPAVPETKFVRVGDVDIAYQVAGDGPVDIVLTPGWISHCELAWELPELARFLTRFTEFGRLVLFDKRGTGMSDRLRDPPTLEERMEDLTAVLDAVGLERASLVAWADGAAMSVVFAATYPDRVTALALGAVTGRVAGDPTVDDWGIDPAALALLAEAVESNWGEGVFLRLLAPSVADDPRFAAWWRRYERSSATPNAAAAMFRSMTAIDVRPFLPLIHAPTLIVQRAEADLLGAAGARWFADRIADCRYVEVPGSDTLPYAGDPEPILDAIEHFLTGELRQAPTSRVLATVLFTDIVGSTEKADAIGDRAWRDLLDAHQAAVRRELARFGGREIDTAGDGFLMTFDGPARAVRCAIAARDAVRGLGMEIRAGVHTGEVELRGDGVSGIAVHIGARAAAQARAGEIVVTSTVKELVTGSSLGFADLGWHALKGVPDEWHLFRVEG